MTNKEYRENIQGVSSFDGWDMLNREEMKALRADIRERVEVFGHIRLNDRATYKVQKDGTAVLVSYKTPVAAICGGVLIRLWSGWSATTQKHINQFARIFGLAGVDKRGWHDMPVQRIA